MNVTFKVWLTACCLVTMHETWFMMTRNYGDRLAGGPMMAVGIGGLALVVLLEAIVYPTVRSLLLGWKRRGTSEDTKCP